MQRLTVEADPISNEVLAFNTDEAVLSIRAVSYLLISDLQIDPDNWDFSAGAAVKADPSAALEEMDRYSKIVERRKTLVERIKPAADATSAEVELTPEELYLLGNGLHRLGHEGVVRALSAVQRGGIKYHPDKKENAVEEILTIQQDAFSLYQELSTIASEKIHVAWAWLVWNTPTESTLHVE